MTNSRNEILRKLEMVDPLSDHECFEIFNDSKLLRNAILKNPEQGINFLRDVNKYRFLQAIDDLYGPECDMQEFFRFTLLAEKGLSYNMLIGAHALGPAFVDPMLKTVKRFGVFEIVNPLGLNEEDDNIAPSLCRNIMLGGDIKSFEKIVNELKIQPSKDSWENHLMTEVYYAAEDVVLSRGRVNEILELDIFSTLKALRNEAASCSSLEDIDRKKLGIAGRLLEENHVPLKDPLILSKEVFPFWRDIQGTYSNESHYVMAAFSKIEFFRLMLEGVGHETLDNEMSPQGLKACARLLEESFESDCEARRHILALLEKKSLKLLDAKPFQKKETFKI